MPQNTIKKTIFWLFRTISPTRMGLLIWLGAYFQAKTLGHIMPTCGPLNTFLGLYGVPKYPKTSLTPIFWLSWTISPTRMGLWIWLGAYFQAYTLGHKSHPLAHLRAPYWVHLEVPRCPKTG
jgi:hypothetical protein